MAFTIRTLSIKAESSIKKVLKDKNHIKTKSKAIEYILEEYNNLDLIKERLNQALEDKEDLKMELNSIKNAISILKNI